MYWAQHGDDAYRRPPGKYEACWSVYVVKLEAVLLWHWHASLHLLCGVLLTGVFKFWRWWKHFFFFKHNVQKVACVPKVTMSSLHPLLFNTRPDVWGFICFKLLYVCFYSVLMWISSAALESSHHRVELKQPRAMWLCELFLLSLWILHSPEWP